MTEGSDFRFLRGFLSALHELQKHGYPMPTPEEAAQALIDEGFRRKSTASKFYESTLENWAKRGS